ncbi:hypothetical protein CMEL01_15360 [Colletotrichum melonis]|uniref:Uncharacterized protein n=1 Tax=Colletotrichum melonis TaxID=1209925 RepID=A0AAI9UGI1_9PEZI|nr:hypothetical protein CMEL01_15360 [Colletotrichum melonis]
MNSLLSCKLTFFSLSLRDTIQRRGNADDGRYGWLGRRLLRLGALQPGSVAASWAVSIFMPLPLCHHCVHWTLITRTHGSPAEPGCNGGILFLLISISPFRPRCNRSITKLPTKSWCKWPPLLCKSAALRSNKYRGMGSLETLAMTNAGVMFLGRPGCRRDVPTTHPRTPNNPNYFKLR